MYTHSLLKASPVAPVAEPFDLAQVKEWLNVDHDDDNSVLTRMITTCRQVIEKATGLKVIPHTVVQRTSTTEAESFPLFYGDATDLTIESMDEPGVLSALDPDQYYQDGNTLGVLQAGDYKITYKVGAAASEDLLEAIKMLIAYRYNNRGDQEKQQGIPDDVQSIIDLNQKICL